MNFFDLGYKVCIATHPEKPNMTRNARGRKLHLASKDKKVRGRPATLCGMMQTEEQTKEMIKNTVFSDEGRECTNCIKEAEKYAQNAKMHL